MFILSSHFYTFCEKTTRLLGLNLLFIIFSLPIITIGAATAALMDTMMQQDVKILKYFLKSFQKHLPKSFPVLLLSSWTLLFLSHLQGLLVTLPFNTIIYFTVLSFLIAYHLNCYLLMSIMTQKGFVFFRKVFYFTLGTFYKTFFFPIVGLIMALIMSIIIQLWIFFFVFVGLSWLFIKFVSRELQLVLDDAAQEQERLI